MVCVEGWIVIDSKASDRRSDAFVFCSLPDYLGTGVIGYSERGYDGIAEISRA